MHHSEVARIPLENPHAQPDPLRLAVAAYLARFTGSSRDHATSDLRCFLSWCTERGLEPTAHGACTWGYISCPAEHVRRPAVPPESPTLGFTYLQFETMLPAARESANRRDFALVAMLGLLSLRIFEATGAEIADLGEEHGHRVLRVRGKGAKVVLVLLPPAVGRAIDRAVSDRPTGPILLNTRGTRMDRHAATRRLWNLAEIAGVRIGRTHPHMLRHTFVTTMLDASVDLRDVQIAARHADPRTTMRYDRARKKPRPAP